jgi:hypothetical protein
LTGKDNPSIISIGDIKRGCKEKKPLMPLGEHEGLLGTGKTGGYPK